jgi:hypothetical protein
MSAADETEADFTLVFLTGGQAQLEDADGKVLWHSDDDAEFREVVPDEFLGEEDAERVLKYLIEADELTEEEAEDCEIEVESLDGDEITDADVN